MSWYCTAARPDLLSPTVAAFATGSSGSSVGAASDLAAEHVVDPSEPEQHGDESDSSTSSGSSKHAGLDELIAVSRRVPETANGRRRSTWIA